MNEKEIIRSVAEMQQELEEVKGKADGMKQDLEGIEPVDLDFNTEALGDTEKEKAVQIKTPADAKKVLNEACTDLQNVIDNLDAICGQAEVEAKEASFKRMSSRYESQLKTLFKNADQAITDAKSAMAHWSFLLSASASEKSITNASLKQAAQTVKEVNKFNKLLQNMGLKREATAVPPTGAKFTGDKWPAKGDPAKVEIHHWEKGADKFKSDKKFEDKRPNPAIDDRLTDAEYGRFGQDAPFVNASFKHNPQAPETSYWLITDKRSGLKVKASFKDAPAVLGPKTPQGLKMFASSGYKRQLLSTVASEGLGVVKAALNGKYVTASEGFSEGDKVKDLAGNKGKIKEDLGNGMYKVKFKDGTKREVPGSDLKARGDKKEEEKSEKTSSLQKKAAGSEERSYYADAYGSKEYAKDLTSGAAPSKQPIGYKPEHDDPNTKQDSTKDGVGTISSKQSVNKAIITAKARRAVDLARKFAATGAIEFTKKAIAAKATELMGLQDPAFKTVEATLAQMPIVNEAALKEAHLPDSETGIVGNKYTGVSDPKGTVDSQGINDAVKGDAKIAKKASMVPQVASSTPQGMQISDMFTTTAKALQNKGVDLEKLRKPRYRM